MFEPRAFAIQPISVRDEHAHNRLDYFIDLYRWDDHSQVPRESLVPRRAPKCKTEEDLLPNLNRFHSDIVGVLDRPDQSSTVERDVELPRQVVKAAVVDDYLGKFLAQWRYIEEFVWINSGRRIGGQVAYVIRSR